MGTLWESMKNGCICLMPLISAIAVGSVFTRSPKCAVAGWCVNVLDYYRPIPGMVSYLNFTRTREHTAHRARHYVDDTPSRDREAALRRHFQRASLHMWFVLFRERGFVSYYTRAADDDTAENN